MNPDILVIDDSAAMRKVLRRLLHATGLRFGTILEAGNGEEALQILKTEEIKLILTDIHMPRMNGWQLLSELQQVEHLKRIPVLVITNEGAPIKRARALNHGVAGYLRKPFTAEQMQEQVKRIFRKTSTCLAEQELAP